MTSQSSIRDAAQHLNSDAASNTNAPAANATPARRGPLKSWQRYLATIALLTVCCLFGSVSHSLGLTDANIVMIYLAGVVLVAALFGRGPAITMAILSVLVFDFFFVHPSFTLTSTETQYFLTLARSARRIGPKGSRNLW
ncbi:MAG: DUF4118 domain-containing protein [Planctomycetia bacterium]|nr:DUF4118 domain-containing protein [Planctomycetia bacterium]